jgi:hypothetical protein
MDTPKDTSRVEKPRHDGRAAAEGAPRTWKRGLRAMGMALALLVMAACASPFAVEVTPPVGSHTTSSGNHTTSSGNLAAAGG